MEIIKEKIIPEYDGENVLYRYIKINLVEASLDWISSIRIER